MIPATTGCWLCSRWVRVGTTIITPTKAALDRASAGGRWILTYYVLVVLSWLGIVWDLKMPPEQVLRNEQRLGSRVIRRTAEQLADVSILSTSRLRSNRRSMRPNCRSGTRSLLLQHRADLRSCPACQLESGYWLRHGTCSRRRYPWTTSSTGAHELLNETVGFLLASPALAAAPKSGANGGA